MKLKSFSSFIGSLLLSCLVAVQPVMAQGTTAISTVVKGPGGGPLAGVTVTLTNAAGAVVGTGTTNAQGGITFVGVSSSAKGLTLTATSAGVVLGTSTVTGTSGEINASAAAIAAAGAGAGVGGGGAAGAGAGAAFGGAGLGSNAIIVAGLGAGGVAGGLGALGGMAVGGLAVGLSGASTSTPAGVVTSIDGLYTVRVNASGTTVAALSGTVELKDKAGKTIKIDVGTGKLFDVDGNVSTKTLAQIVAEEKAAKTDDNPDSVTSSLALALKTVADQVKTGAYGANATTALATLVKVLTTANPDATTAYLTTAVDAVTSPKSGVSDKAASVAILVQSSGVREGSDAALAATRQAQTNGVIVVTTTGDGSATSLLNSVDLTLPVASPSSP